MSEPALTANPTPTPVNAGSKVGNTEAPPIGGVKQTDDEDIDKVSYADESRPYEEASNSNVGVSTSTKYSSYSGYPTDDLEQTKIVGLR